MQPWHILLFYAFDFSLSATVVVPETVDVASVGVCSAAHANDGNLANSAARYFGWLEARKRKRKV